LIARFVIPAPLLARGLSLRPEQAEDQPFLQDLYIRHRWDEFAALPLLAQQFSMQHGQYRANYPEPAFLVLAGPAGVAGRFYLYRQGQDIRLIDILLAPALRNQGIGSALLAALVDLARQDGCSVSLQVDKLNPAQSLYRRLGFVESADIGHAWLMRQA
jgi:ribosomal protein S18 acetylase RimI-like enzyme